MAKLRKGKTRKNIAEQVSSQGKINLIASIVSGLVMSAVFVLITGRYLEALLVLAASVVTCQVLRITNNIMIRRIADKFESELEAIKQGDYSKFLEPRSFWCAVRHRFSAELSVERYKVTYRQFLLAVPFDHPGIEKGGYYSRTGGLIHFRDIKDSGRNCKRRI